MLGPVGQGYKIAIETLNEGRIGIGAQMIGVARGALEAAIGLRQGAEAVRQGDRRVPGRAVPAGPDGDRPRGRAPHGVQRGPAQGRRPAVHPAGRDGQAVQLPGGRPDDLATASSCSAGTATPRSTRRRSTTATPRSARSTRAPATCSCRPSRRRCSSDIPGDAASIGTIRASDNSARAAGDRRHRSNHRSARLLHSVERCRKCLPYRSFGPPRVGVVTPCCDKSLG